MYAGPGDPEICPSTLNGAFLIAAALVPDIVAVNLSDEITAPVTVFFIHSLHTKNFCAFTEYWFAIHLSDVITEQIDLNCVNVINLCALQNILFPNSYKHILLL